MNSNKLHTETQLPTDQAGRLRLIVDVDLAAAGYQAGRAADLLEAVASAVRNCGEELRGPEGKEVARFVEDGGIVAHAYLADL